MTGKVIRFPQDRVNHYSFKPGGAVILVLPVVRVEREPWVQAANIMIESQAIIATETFEAVSRSFQLLRESLMTSMLP